MDDSQWLRLIYLLLVLALVAPLLRARRHGSWLTHAAVWVAILVGLVWAYETFLR